MRIRPAILLPMLALLGAGPLAAQGAGITYAPGTSQYRVTSVFRQTSEHMGELIEVEFRTTQLLTVGIERETPDTMRVVMVIDSMQVATPQAPDVSRLVGLRVVGTMSPRGRIHDLQPSGEHAGDEGVEDIVLALRSFLVGLPATLRAGVMWTDTTESTIESEDLDLARRAITESTLAGDTSYAGQRAHRIRQSITLTMSGVSTAEGITALLAGSGTGTATHYVTTGGVYLGSRSEQETDLEVSVGEMTMTLRQRTSAVVARIR